MFGKGVTVKIAQTLIGYITIGALTFLMTSFGGAGTQDRGFVDPDPNGELAAKRFFAEAEERRVLDNLVSRLIEVQSALSDESEAQEFLELTEGQKEEIDLLKEQYSEQLASEFPDHPGAAKADFRVMTSCKEYTFLSPEDRQRMNDIRREMMIKYSKILVADQLDRLSSMDKRVGLAKMVINSPIGNMIELRDAQRSRIIKESSELAKEIDEFVAKAKSKSQSIIKDNLSESQWDKLEKIVGKEYVESYPRGFPVEFIGANHRFEERE